MKTFYVYILTNVKHSVLYIGSTNNLSHCMTEHHNKIADGFTKKYNIQKLVYFEVTDDLYTSLNREKQLKSWRRDKKEWLINQVNPEWKDLIYAIA